MEETVEELLRLQSWEFFTEERALAAGIPQNKLALVTRLANIGMSRTGNHKAVNVGYLVSMMTNSPGNGPVNIGPKIWAIARQMFKHYSLLLPVIPPETKKKKK